ncbi:CHASE2 domain-containing protein [Leptospira sp. GIMC2001]|uniref:CHASE2 domain-containing protein n=1 Tax=Leptospira sp. GIMC2001 TaxID=1513297 RepID=UPI00234BD06A|nr:adenylate/guanylate cyclase domain-containing protein [Leptospira sp. GIMC2001]WCL48125.1 adenylate/guanylate cyclase domain-containing protein [Leptospira sp. GIMC2001]
MRLPAKSISYSLSLFIPSIILWIFYNFGILEIWNRKISDFLMTAYPNHHEFSKDVVILDIDEHSLSYYADHPDIGRWPWKRSIYPAMYSYLNMAGAKFIIVDILFTERSQEDESLVIANESFPNISNAVSLRDEVFENKVSGNQSKWENYKINLEFNHKFPQFGRASFPNGEIGSTSKHLHVVNVIPDTDGVLRRFAPFLGWGDFYFPSLAVVGYYANQPIDFSIDENQIILKNQEIESEPIKINKNGFIRSYFYSSDVLKNIPRYSASQVLESFSRIQDGLLEDESQLLVPLSAFENKIVLLGTTAPATHDDVVTPFGLYPGVVVQAAFVSNLIENHVFKETSLEWGIFFCLLFMVIITYFLFHTDNHWLRILIPIGLMVLIGSSSYVAYINDYLLPLSPFAVSLPISFILGYSYVTFKEGRERRKFNSVLRNLVDPSVVSLALLDIDALKKGGEWEITAFFSDVASFSQISEELTATELASLLNEYLSAMTEELKNHSGTLDKYIGDAIVGIFGAPIRIDSHSKDACLTALAMLVKLEKLREKWVANNSYSKNAQNMKFRIGLNTGHAKVGFMGTESLASYTMMGDMVNLAARLEAAAKDYGVPILVSEYVYEKTSEDFHFLQLDRIRVKGKEKPVSIYSLIAKKGDLSNEELKWIDSYGKGFEEYSSRNWQKAISYFEQCIHEKGKKDIAAELLIERCKLYNESPPPMKWDGVFTRDFK